MNLRLILLREYFQGWEVQGKMSTLRGFWSFLALVLHSKRCRRNGVTGVLPPRDSWWIGAKKCLQLSKWSEFDDYLTYHEDRAGCEKI